MTTWRTWPSWRAGSPASRSARPTLPPGLTLCRHARLEQLAYSDYVRMRELGKTLKIRHATVSRVGGFVAEETETEDQDDAPQPHLLVAGAQAPARAAAGAAVAQAAAGDSFTRTMPA